LCCRTGFQAAGDSGARRLPCAGRIPGVSGGQGAHGVIKAGLSAPNYLLKLIPHVDGSPRICKLVEYYLEDIDVKGAWTGPAALSLIPHALAPVAELAVLEVVAATHCVADLTLGLGKVVHDYLR